MLTPLYDLKMMERPNLEGGGQPVSLTIIASLELLDDTVIICVVVNLDLHRTGPCCTGPGSGALDPNQNPISTILIL